MQRVLVTGGAGFFGIHLVKGLLEKGYHIKVLDIEDLKVPEIEGRIEFIKTDVRDRDAVESACKDIDILFHVAAILPISRSKKKIYWDVNVRGTKNILEASLRNNIKKVIFMSSAATYGIPKEVPITENTEFNPVCNYGRSKIEAEKICNEYRARGLNIIILRPRTLVGANRLGIFQIFFSWIADGKNVYIIGEGSNLFQLLSTRDLVDVCILSIENNSYNEDFNLGTDKFSTVRGDLQDLIDYAKTNSRIISLPSKISKTILSFLDILNLSPFTPWHYLTPDKPFYFDITKAQRVLGWQPQDSNFQMYKISYNWYLSHRKEVDNDFGTTHRKSTRQKIIRILRKLI